MAYEVFAYWNGQELRAALDAVAAIMGGGDFLGLMRAVVLVGLLSAVTYALLSQRGAAAGSFLAGVVFAYAALFVPKVTVTVIDVRAATSYAVANVPIGLAVTYSSVSHIGHWLTQQYESRFTTLDDERFSKTGMVFGARVLETMALQGFPDPGLKADVATFYKDCVVPEVIDTPSLSKTIRETKDLTTVLTGIVNPGRGTSLGVVTDAGSTAMACNRVMPAIASYMAANSTSNAAMGKMGRVVRANEGLSQTNALLIATTDNDINSMLGNLLSISDTAQQALAQSMWINGIHDADMALRNGYGNAATTSYTTAVAEQASRQSAYAGKLWAEKALPMIRNIVEFIMIAAFPLVFIIMLVAGEKALMVLKYYVQVLASLALWAPFTAIINYLVITNGKQAMLAMKDASAGLSLDNINGMVDLALQQQSFAGQLFLAVPMIAYALVSAGAQASTAAVGGLTSGATSAAGSVGGQVAQGNVNAGQVGWRNTSALNTSTGQSNTAMTTRSGFVQDENGAGTTTYGGGAPAGGFFNGKSSQLGAMQATLASSVESGFSKSASSSMSAARSSISSALESIKSAHASGFRSENSERAEKSFSAALATNDSTQRQRLADDGASFATKAAQAASSSDSKRNDLATSIKGAFGIGAGGGSLGLSASSTETHSQTKGTNAQVDSTGTSNQGSKNSVGSSTGTEEKGTVSSSASHSASKTSFAQTQLEKATTFGKQGAAQAQKASQATEQIQASRNDSGGIKQDLANQITAALGGAESARALYGKDQAGFASAVSKAAEGLIAAKGLGPGEGSQIQGASGTNPTTSGQVDAAKSAIEGKVASEIANAPTKADSPPSSLAKGGATTTTSGGPKRGRASGNPYSKSAVNAAQKSGGGSASLSSGLRTPGNVDSPDGAGQRSSGNVIGGVVGGGAQTKRDVSDQQADTSRKVGKVADKANIGR